MSAQSWPVAGRLNSGVRALGLSIYGCAGSRCCNSLAQARRSTFPRRTFDPVSSKGKPLAGGLPKGGLFPSCLWASHTRLSVGAQFREGARQFRRRRPNYSFKPNLSRYAGQVGLTQVLGAYGEDDAR